MQRLGPGMVSDGASDPAEASDAAPLQPVDAAETCTSLTPPEPESYMVLHSTEAGTKPRARHDIP